MELVTCISYLRPYSGPRTITVAIYSDAGRYTDLSQLFFDSSVLLGTLAKESRIHVIPWVSHRLNLTARSIGAGGDARRIRINRQKKPLIT